MLHNINLKKTGKYGYIFVKLFPAIFVLSCVSTEMENTTIFPESFKITKAVYVIVWFSFVNVIVDNFEREICTWAL